MNVLIGCEFSQIVTREFRLRGHNAYSCDLLPGEINPDWHLQRDIREVIYHPWDLAVFFPPCTHLCISGARWFKDKVKEQEEALEFVRTLLDAPIDKICLENPIGVISTKIRKPSQIVQPWMFGHGETKATCLWLKNLPLLVPTNVVEGREHRIHRMPPSPGRSKLRSVAFEGLGRAMAGQWSNL